MYATAYDSFWLQLDRMRASHGAAELGVGAFRIAALVMPLAAMSLSVSRSARMALRGIAGWSRGSVVRRSVAIAGVGAAVAATAFVWWPDGDYEPIRPGEKGTVVEAVRAVPQLPSGRPSFTPEQAATYGTVPTERERRATAGLGHDAQPDPGTDAYPGPFEDGVGDEDPATGTDPGFDYPAGAGEPSATRATSPKERPPVSARATCWRSNSARSSRIRVSVSSAASGSPAAAASPASAQIRCPETDTLRVIPAGDSA
jgi:hypothetical protein